jgi:hypothetical protein
MQETIRQDKLPRSSGWHRVSGIHCQFDEVLHDVPHVPRHAGMMPHREL